MNAVEAICSTIACASSETGPISPIASPAAAKIEISAAMVAPIGRPRRHSLAKAGQSGRQRLTNSR